MQGASTEKRFNDQERQIADRSAHQAEAGKVYQPSPLSRWKTLCGVWVLGRRGVIWACSERSSVYAVKRKVRPDSPVHGIDKPADVKRMRRLSESEYAQLWSALQAKKNVASDVILFLAVTGWRSGGQKSALF
jgi:hypothetical protein